MKLSRSDIPFGIIHFMAYPATIRGGGPVVETLKTVAEDDYFRLIELTHIESDQQRKEAVSILRNAGKRYAYGAQPCLLINKANLNDPDKDARNTAVTIVKNAVDEATEIEAEALAFLSGKDPGQEKRAEAKKLLADSVLQICSYAGSRNPELNIILETFDRAIFGKNALLGPTCESVEFAQSIRNDFQDFGLMIDLSHLPILGEASRDALTAAKDVLSHIHVGNCVIRHPEHPAYGDEHPQFGIEEGENGVEELTEFMKILTEIEYLNADSCGAVSFEVKPMPGQDSSDVIQNAKDTMNLAMDKLRIK